MIDMALKSAAIEILSPNASIGPVPSSYPKCESSNHRRMRATHSESSLLSLLSGRATPEHRYFVAQFLLPSTSTVRTRLLDFGHRICLRSLSANRYHLSGTVLVREDVLDKRVFVRYTLDNWRTCIDKQATFLDYDLASGADRFHFRLDFPFRLPNDTRLQLAAACSVNGQTHWDNNGGLDYLFTYNKRSNRSSISE